MENHWYYCKNSFNRGGINLIDCYSDKFIQYLETHDIEGIRSIPKSDLHNHFVLGGNREYIKEKAGIDIPYFEGVLHSMSDMHEWNAKYIGNRFGGTKSSILLICMGMN